MWIVIVSLEYKVAGFFVSLFDPTSAVKLRRQRGAVMFIRSLLPNEKQKIVGSWRHKHLCVEEDEEEEIRVPFKC